MLRYKINQLLEKYRKDFFSFEDHELGLFLVFTFNAVFFILLLFTVVFLSFSCLLNVLISLSYIFVFIIIQMYAIVYLCSLLVIN